MMFYKVEKIIKERDITIPSLLFYHYKKLGITAEEVLLLTYLMNGEVSFNPKKISEELSLDLSELMDLVEHLKKLNLISIELKKINNVRTEIINMDGFFDKLIGLVLDDDDKQEQKETIYDVFEKEFGRTLSPMEYEIINAWQENHIEQETIVLALKEAVYNGVNNLRYIDRILSEWNKKGIKTKEDLEKEKVVFSQKRIQQTKNVETIDYDWLNDEG